MFSLSLSLSLSIYIYGIPINLTKEENRINTIKENDNVVRIMRNEEMPLSSKLILLIKIIPFLLTSHQFDVDFWFSKKKSIPSCSLLIS